MMSKIWLTIFLMHFAILNAPVVAFGLPDAKVTVKVVDEEGQPIEGVKAGVSFEVYSNLEQGVKHITKEGYTDGSGLFTETAPSMDDISYGARKEGYYESIGKHHFTEVENGRWIPWNPKVQLLLRKIVRPVPMFARDTKKSHLEIPIAGKEVGLDLIEYDWVTPYGNGRNADFVFRLDKKHVSRDDFESTLTLTFPNKFDGFLLIKENRRYGSIFKLPRTAPLAGYQNKLSRTIKRLPGKGIEKDFRDENNYIFRIRSEEKDDKFERAMYGKIQGDIEVYPGNSKTARIIFKYYLNPDYTQNLEYDPSQNLFLDLRDRRRLDWVGM